MYTKLQKFLRENEIDIALFFNTDAHITYFAGIKPESACLAVPSSGKPVIFILGFEAARFAKESSIDVVHVEKDLIGSVHAKFSAKKIGIIPTAASYGTVQKVKNMWKAGIVPIEEFCRDLRLVKSKEEITHVTKACAVTHKLFDELCENMDSFRTETDAAGFLKMRMTQLGFEPSFPPIVASGPNGSVPHHVPNDSRLNGFTVIDFGIIYKNYCSDMTRTVFVGNPSKKNQRVYQKLLKIQNQCIDKVKPGASFENINDFARKAVGKTMVHRVGHSLGIEVHDVQTRPMKLQTGNVITIEPGTYHPGKFGIRIEDDVLVTRKEPVVLTQTPKDLQIFAKQI